MNKKVVTEVNNKGKKEEVKGMFNTIAKRYDILDHVMSFCIDELWRIRAIRGLKKHKPKIILDIATGTADIAIKQARIIKPEKIIGVDISKEMLDIGRKKVASKKLSKVIELEIGDAEDLRFEDNKFDAVSVAFGVRNFENLKDGLNEMYRVLKNDGAVMILEFSIPKNILVNKLYLLYFNRLVPFIGGLITKNKKAYKYLPGSVSSFPYGTDFEKILIETGFKNVIGKKLSFGICTVYSGVK